MAGLHGGNGKGRKSPLLMPATMHACAFSDSVEILEPHRRQLVFSSTETKGTYSNPDRSTCMSSMWYAPRSVDHERRPQEKKCSGVLDCTAQPTDYMKDYLSKISSRAVERRAVGHLHDLIKHNATDAATM